MHKHTGKYTMKPTQKYANNQTNINHIIPIIVHCNTLLQMHIHKILIKLVKLQTDANIFKLINTQYLLYLKFFYNLLLTLDRELPIKHFYTAHFPWRNFTYLSWSTWYLNINGCCKAIKVDQHITCIGFKPQWIGAHIIRHLSVVSIANLTVHILRIYQLTSLPNSAFSRRQELKKAARKAGRKGPIISAPRVFHAGIARSLLTFTEPF